MNKISPRHFFTFLLPTTLMTPSLAFGWNSELGAMTPVTVYRNVESVPGSSQPVLEPLPDSIEAALGSRTANYESFKIGYLSRPAAEALAELARQRGLVVRVGLSRSVHLGHRTFQSDAPDERFPPANPTDAPPTAVPNRWMVQFAFPIHSEWLSAFDTCGVRVLKRYPKRAVLVEAYNLGEILTCGVTDYLEWADRLFNVDRINPELLAEEGTGLHSYELHLIPGTSEEELALEVSEIGLIRSFRSSSRRTTATVEITPDNLRTFVATTPLLVRVDRSSSGVSVSGERQAQVVAGQYDSTGQVSPGYQAFLTGRGLWSQTNIPAVAVFDTGINQGTYSGSQQHPWLANPIDALDTMHAFEYEQDVSGHGTFVAGIIAANPTLTSSPPSDGDGFTYAFGISPFSKLWEVKYVDVRDDPPYTCWGDLVYKDSERYQAGLNFVTNGKNAASITNNSWFQWAGCSNQYTSLSVDMDEWVRDATQNDDPMTIVFAAGNHACSLPNAPCEGALYCGGLGGTSDPETIDAPATSRNVITVGATENDYAEADSCDPGHVPDKIYRVADFSGQGSAFLPSPGPAMLHTTRVKPDLVAPGWSVHSTIPMEAWPPPSTPPGLPPYHCKQGGCEDYFPLGEEMTYGVGTSFAAPAVSGAAALFTKKMRDVHQVTPRPSLIKAALVATADELWDYSTQACWGGDCRPSYKGGWGRLNIDRLTNITIDTVFENEGTALVQGQTVTVASGLVVDDPTKDVLIVLAWSDAPDAALLVNDLDLTVKGTFDAVTRSCNNFYGNNFSENINGNDDGYSYAFPGGCGPSSFGGGYTKVNDETNNVEAVFISASYLAQWPGGVAITDILVTAQDIGSMDPSSQDFSLFAYNLVLAP